MATHTTFAIHSGPKGMRVVVAVFGPFGGHVVEFPMAPDADLPRAQAWVADHFVVAGAWLHRDDGAVVADGPVAAPQVVTTAMSRGDQRGAPSA